MIMYSDKFRNILRSNLEKTEESGTFKRERVITSRQGTFVDVNQSGEVLNFCANNYLGLSGDQRLVDTAC